MRNRIYAQICYDKRCVFHKNETDCTVPTDQRSCICRLGIVELCANKTYERQRLQTELKEGAENDNMP